jgi:hypothetical protein
MQNLDIGECPGKALFGASPEALTILSTASVFHNSSHAQRVPFRCEDSEEYNRTLRISQLLAAIVGNYSGLADASMACWGTSSQTLHVISQHCFGDGMRSSLEGGRSTIFCTGRRFSIVYNKYRG